MKACIYYKYLSAKESGLKKLASEHIRSFVDSFRNHAEKILWTKCFLEEERYGHKIRHELYKEVIFPVLLEGFRDDDAWSLYYLGKTVQNLYSDRKLHTQVDQLSDFEFFERCYQKEPNLFNIRESFADTVWRSISFGVHEWPSGLCYEASKIEEDIEYLRKLDHEGLYRLGIQDVEQVL